MDFVFRRSYRGPLKAVILDWAGTTMEPALDEIQARVSRGEKP